MTVSSCFAPVFSSKLANKAEILRSSFLFSLYLLKTVDATREVLMEEAGDARQGRSGREHKIKCVTRPSATSAASSSHASTCDSV